MSSIKREKGCVNGYCFTFYTAKHNGVTEEFLSPRKAYNYACTGDPDYNVRANNIAGISAGIYPKRPGVRNDNYGS